MLELKNLKFSFSQIRVSHRLQNGKEKKKASLATAGFLQGGERKLFIPMVTASSHFYATGTLCSCMLWRKEICEPEMVHTSKSF